MASNSISIRLTQGEMSNVSAEVLCTLHQAKCGSTNLNGAYLEGPFSNRGRTLPSKYPLKSTSVKIDSYHTFHAVIPEPAFWTPRMPSYYELRGIPTLPEQYGTPLVQTRIGLREVHVRKESFYQEQRRWVVRACAASPEKVLSEVDQWREADLIPIISFEIGLEPLLDKTMDLGLPLIIDFSKQPTEHWLKHFTSCSQYASTSFALAPPIEDHKSEFIRSKHLIFGRSLDCPGHPSHHAQFMAVSEAILRNGWSPDRRLPIVATRECNAENRSPAEIRAMCDDFQADLDHGADYAGLWLLPKATS